MSDTSKLKSCPKCGRPIPAEAPQGLCPKCLLLQASIPTETGKGEPSKSTPPTQAELAAAFPQLEILELIGQGGMGFVFKARQRKIERFVALKILPQSLAADPAFAERFTREGRMLARLNHPNIVTIHDFGQANGWFYLLMEFVDGVNLRQAMRIGRFTPAQALAVVPKICEALQFAHNEGILHRDIKPENILLDSKGRVKIADFGIAKLMGEPHPDTSLTGTGAVVGTPHYMAPEQLEKSGEVDHRADIYSLGVVFYEMLTGELPLGKFQAPSEKVQVDVRLDEVVLHALEKEPARRYQQVSQVKTAVETISCTAAAASAPPGSPPIMAATAPRTQRPDLFWRRFALVGGLAVLALILIPIIAILVAMYVPAFSKAPERATAMRQQIKANSTTSPLKMVGAVTDSANGKPVPDARVVDRLLRDSVAGNWLQETRTDPNGNFQLSTTTTEDHQVTVSAPGYETSVIGLVGPFNKTIGRFDIHLQPKIQNANAQTAKAVVPTDATNDLFNAGSSDQPPGELVIDTEQYEIAHPEPGELDWGFKCFVPPGHMASILFVRWTNGVPQVDPGFSGYFKVGKNGGIDIPFCSMSCYRIPESQFAGLNEAARRELLAGWAYPESSGLTNAVRWNVNVGLGFTSSRWMSMPPYHGLKLHLPQSIRSGHQRVLRLVDFDTPEGNANHGQSGVELRVFLEPLKSSPIRLVPNEVDRTNHIAGRGLAGTMEDALRAIKQWPTDP